MTWPPPSSITVDAQRYNKLHAGGTDTITQGLWQTSALAGRHPESVISSTSPKCPAYQLNTLGIKVNLT